MNGSGVPELPLHLPGVVQRPWTSNNHPDVPTRTLLGGGRGSTTGATVGLGHPEPPPRSPGPPEPLLPPGGPGNPTCGSGRPGGGPAGGPDGTIVD